MRRVGHQARPAVVLMRGFHETRTLRESSGREKAMACSRHHVVRPGSGSVESARGDWVWGVFARLRTHEGKRNSSCEKVRGIRGGS